MKTYNIEVVNAGSDIVGEGPVWCEENNSLYWIDILGKKLYRKDFNTEEVITYDLPSFIGCFAIGTDDQVYLMLEDGLYSLDEQTRKMTFISVPKDHKKSHRFNDGKCDSKGRLYVASMSNDLNDGGGDKSPSSSLYYVDETMKFVNIINKAFVIPNGLAWNDDLEKFYHIDSVTSKVTEYDYDEASGHVSNPKTIIQFDGTDGVPDGMTIDNNGNLWIAHWGGSKLSLWDPRTGKKLEEIPMPCENITSCVFGGALYDELYITSANISDESDKAGHVFKIKLDVGGQPLTRFETKEM